MQMKISIFKTAVFALVFSCSSLLVYAQSAPTRAMPVLSDTVSNGLTVDSKTSPSAMADDGGGLRIWKKKRRGAVCIGR